MRSKDKSDLVGQLGAARSRIAELEAELAQNATRDALVTNLLTLRAFNSQLQLDVERAHRYGRPLSLAVLDVDRFGQYNVAHGYESGDALLIQIGHTITDQTRINDIACRIGSDEFSVLYAETPGPEAKFALERMVEAFTRLTHGLSVSAGIAALMEGQQPEEFLAAAAQALERARTLGGGRVIGDIDGLMVGRDAIRKPYMPPATAEAAAVAKPSALAAAPAEGGGGAEVIAMADFVAAHPAADTVATPAAAASAATAPIDAPGVGDPIADPVTEPMPAVAATAVERPAPSQLDAGGPPDFIEPVPIAPPPGGVGADAPSVFSPAPDPFAEPEPAVKSGSHIFSAALADSAASPDQSADSAAAAAPGLSDDAELLRVQGEFSEAAAQIAAALNLEAEIEMTRAIAYLENFGHGTPGAQAAQVMQGLDPASWDPVRTDLLAAAAVVDGLPGHAAVAAALRGILEKWNGTGLSGLKGTDIPAASRIVSPLSRYFELTTVAPFGDARNRDEAITEVARGSGTSYEPAVVDKLIGYVYGRPS